MELTPTYSSLLGSSDRPLKLRSLCRPCSPAGCPPGLPGPSEGSWSPESAGTDAPSAGARPPLRSACSTTKVIKALPQLRAISKCGDKNMRACCRTFLILSTSRWQYFVLHVTTGLTWVCWSGRGRRGPADSLRGRRPHRVEERRGREVTDPWRNLGLMRLTHPRAPPPSPQAELLEAGSSAGLGEDGTENENSTSILIRAVKVFFSAERATREDRM